MSFIPSSSLKYLELLREHNDREWFNKNKDTYQQELAHFTSFVEELLFELRAVDQLQELTAKKCVRRIYRDTRFSKDKRPYNPRFGASFSRIKPYLRGGYFMKIMPGECQVGGGFFAPNSEDLKLIRSQIAQDASPLRNVLQDVEFTSAFGALRGKRLKVAPKGYSKDHLEIDLLRYQSLYVVRAFADHEVSKPGFLSEALKTFLLLRPFFDVMTDYLTTDLNGVSLI
jgi:uncharacterized protein (TIGR02453 family)